LAVRIHFADQRSAIKGKFEQDSFGKRRVVSWKSSNDAIATVDANGLVTFRGPGKFPKKMKPGAVYPLKVKLNKATATGVRATFTSSKDSVIRVDRMITYHLKAGKLFALKKGKATITIKGGKKRIKKKITVK
jgi:uncharacterized protein YjdB